MEYPEENALNIYSSMLKGPRRGGAGIVFVLVDADGNEETHEEMLPAYADTTQNQMELEGSIQALKARHRKAATVQLVALPEDCDQD